MTREIRLVSDEGGNAGSIKLTHQCSRALYMLPKKSMTKLGLTKGIRNGQSKIWVATDRCNPGKSLFAECPVSLGAVNNGCKLYALTPEESAHEDVDEEPLTTKTTSVAHPSILLGV